MHGESTAGGVPATSEVRGHDWDVEIMWCRRCGRTQREVVQDGPYECDGLEGVVHERYVRARKVCDDVFNTTFKALGIDV